MPSDLIYFIKKGNVVMTWKEYMNLPIAVFQEGMFFGEFEVYKNVPRFFNCVAITEVECLILHKKDFKRIFFRNFPEIGRYFVNEMNSKFSHIEYTMESLYGFLQNETNPINKSKLFEIKNEIQYLSKISKMTNNDSNSSKYNKKT